MASNVTLTSSGLTVTHYHDNASADVLPRYEGKFVLTPNLDLTVTFSDTGTGWFDFDVGFIATGSNGKEVFKKDRFSFGTSYGYGNSVTLLANLSDFTFPITLSFVCTGCDHEKNGTLNFIEWLDGSSTWIISDGRHTHINNPGPPKILWTSGTKISVDNGKDGICCTTINGNEWHDSPHTFENLNKGSSYSFKCREYCDDCPDNKVYTSTSVTAKTWNIFGNCIGTGVASMTFKARHTAGTLGNASKHNVIYKLCTSKNLLNAIETKSSTNNTSVTFTGLDPGKTYYCYAYTDGIDDNNCWIDASTKKPVTIQSNTGDVSAKTLRASVNWNSGDAISVNCTILCNGQYKNISNSGDYVGFTRLTPGSTYDIYWSVSSTYIINDETGETEVIETTGSFSLTTKKASFVRVNKTSKIIQFSSKSNNSSDVMEQKLGTEDWYEINQNELSIHNNLECDTMFMIHCRIADCYAFNSSGDQTNNNDSAINQLVRTHSLSLELYIYETHQHSIITSCQAKVNDINTDADRIDRTPFNFYHIDTKAIKSNPPYQSSEVIEDSDGITTGDYQVDKKVYSNNLTWYYCKYMIIVQITDGYNIIREAIIANTIFPAAWIYSGGQWHRYMGHVYTDNKWVPAPAFIYKNNKFIEPNGE